MSGRLMAGIALGLSLVLSAAIIADTARDVRITRQVPSQVSASAYLVGQVVEAVGRPVTNVEDMGVLRNALHGDPLDQSLLNRLVVAISAGRGAFDPRATTLLGALGWRDNAAQQTLLLDAARRNDIVQALDRIDGLLRRQRLREQTYGTLTALEADTASRPALIARLAAAPWRAEYLAVSGQNTDPAFGPVHLRTLDALRRSGVRLGRAETVPFIRSLLAQGNAAAAYAFWSADKSQRPRDQPTRDADFSALAPRGTDPTHVAPFEWNLLSGEGFAATRAEYRQGKPNVRWDGRATPAFLTQLVPIRVGERYRMTLTGRPDEGRLADAIAVSLSCPGTRAVFEPVGSNGDMLNLRLNDAGLTCPFATLAIEGSRQRETRPVDLELDGASLSVARP